MRKMLWIAVSFFAASFAFGANAQAVTPPPIAAKAFIVMDLLVSTGVDAVP